MIEGRPRESLVLYENPIEVCATSSKNSKAQFNNVFIF